MSINYRTVIILIRTCLSLLIQNNGRSISHFVSPFTPRDGVKLVKATSEGAEIHLLEGTSNGSAYVGLACPDDKGSDASYVITLPSAAPTANGQALTATTAGVASWGNVESTKAGGAIYENSQTISTTHTLTANTNGMSAGPVTVNDGITLTIPSGATYTIV